LQGEVQGEEPGIDKNLARSGEFFENQISLISAIASLRRLLTGT
jgi:hypothetical protein